MGWVVDCECGESVRGDTEDTLVSAVGVHVSAKHPELVGTLSREDVIAMAQQT